MAAQKISAIQFLYACGVVFVVMGVLDGVWLGLIAKDFYKREMGSLMTDSVRVVPAAIYYVLYPVAIVFLALLPSQSLGEAVLRSAVLGLTAFGVYDLTSLAIVKGYSMKMTVVDMAWGTFASAVGGGAGYWFVLGRLARG